MTMTEQPGLVTIDGPSGSGKGTIADLLAQKLGWHVLDSGALYRILALVILQEAIAPNDVSQVLAQAKHLQPEFKNGQIRLENKDITTQIRSEEVGMMASQLAALPEVRDELLAWQRQQWRHPGLVADGRDMGTVVFPQAPVKIFLDASVEERAQRRYKQLKEKGLHASIISLLRDLQERDARDRNRPVAPLQPHEDAVIIDSTGIPIEQILIQIIAVVREVYPQVSLVD